ncbi:hypothetical protein CSA37_06490 [Candidatus Fermentibacteria bacterium]|nr:MAG: hypothetical protein CSA37_06490 [Candidatus Fermentibacteria bacterium]
MKTLVIMAVLAAAAFGGLTEFGPQIGYWFPSGDAGDVYSGSFYFGGQVLSHMAVVAIEGSIGYVPLKLDDDYEDALEASAGGDIDFSGHIIPITAGVRSYSGKIYAAGGLELDIASAEIEFPDGTDADDSDSEIGGYIGAGIITPLVGTGDIDISAKLHLMDFDTDEMWIGIQGGINF